ncbi:MAG: 4-oxalomesaconate tautomerase [Hyphomicrobiales bacterium]|nr:4-oxalomesaconate tautomerase [Hyphomicrobiales bacterium]MDE2114181.1 4-oxalomesaconate tautomerase [Hyphomicrobiales bacterium]
MSDQIGIPCLFMRGGTSRGPYFNAHDLPTDVSTRDKVLLAAMGSPDKRQIDGLGGADTLTSKVAIVSKSTRPGIDLDYLFAQVDINRAFVDTAPSCGNMLAGVAPYGIETGLIQATPGQTRVMIFNVNTSARIEAVVETPNAQIIYGGNAAIAGVPGTAAPIILNFMDVIGSLTGALLPTGHAREDINGVEVTCVDVAMPMILLRASDFGLRGDESKAEIDSNKPLFVRLEPIRLEAGRRMGLGDVSGKVVPKIGLLSPARDGGTITSRYLTPHALHAAHAVTGAVCIASACSIPGTIAAELAVADTANPRTIWIEHPSGKVDVLLTIEGSGASLKITAGTMRTARPIMRGEVYVPKALFAG